MEENTVVITSLKLARLCKSILGLTQRNFEQLSRLTLSKNNLQKNETKSNYAN